MIRELIEKLARELAAHDGVPVTIVHLHAAASNLVAELAREKDAAIAVLLRSTTPAPEQSAAAPPDASAPAEPNPAPEPAAGAGDPSGGPTAQVPA